MHHQNQRYTLSVPSVPTLYRCLWIAARSGRLLGAFVSLVVCLYIALGFPGFEFFVRHYAQGVCCLSGIIEPIIPAQSSVLLWWPRVCDTMMLDVTGSILRRALAVVAIIALYDTVGEASRLHRDVKYMVSNLEYYRVLLDHTDIQFQVPVNFF